MRKVLGLVVICALFTTPMFASKLFGNKGTTVYIPDLVTVASTQIAAGEYNVTYEGAGPDVKVTLLKSGKAPVVLNAKLVAGKNNGPSVTLVTVNGTRVLKQMDVKGGTLVFDETEVANK